MTPGAWFGFGSLGWFWQGFPPLRRPSGGGTHPLAQFLLTVFFDALNDGENLSQPRFDLLDFGSETALGNSLNIPFCSFDS